MNDIKLQLQNILPVEGDQYADVTLCQNKFDAHTTILGFAMSTPTAR